MQTIILGLPAGADDLGHSPRTLEQARILLGDEKHYEPGDL